MTAQPDYRDETHSVSSLPANTVYEASHISADNDNKRHRATKDEMEERAVFLLAYAKEHRPVTVRQLFYAAVSHRVPGVRKDENGYAAVQRQVLDLRRCGRMPYHWIADLTRFMRGVETFDSVWDALNDTARLYRRVLWRDKDVRIEFWLEKDALAGCIEPVTSEYAVPLMVCRGFTSETFAYEAVETFARSGQETHVFHLGDFDRSGQDAADDLERKLMGFAATKGAKVSFAKLMLRLDDIERMGLVTRPPKRETPADRRWPHDFACDLDAVPPDTLRAAVRGVCSHYMPDREMTALLAAEQSEKSFLKTIAQQARESFS
jgi:hypothetical protein